MTISYTHLSHTAGWVGGLTRLLFIWKGSLFKQIWPDFCLFFGLYAVLSVLYRVILIEYEDHKIKYELFCVYCERFSGVIPISFLLGFYVTQVVSRWWAQFMSLPWPDTLARYMAVYMPGTDEVSRNYRRTVVRWACLGNVMALRLVSYKVMVRFPTLDHLVSSGLATPREMLQLQKLNDLIQNRHQITWYPNMWAQNLLRKARKEGLIQNDWFAHVLIKEVDSMANLNGMLICYGWINIPLVYTQVVTLATYAYFVACLFGRQYLLPTQYKVEGDAYVPVAKFPSVSNWTGTLTPGATNIIGYNNDVADFVIPVFTVLEYLFYMGWLKVAETLLNPFGEDDDDFDTYYLIDRNLQIAYVMVDEAGAPIDPEMDPFNDSPAPELQYTEFSTQYLDDAKPHLPTDDLKLTDKQAHVTTVRSRRSSSQVGMSMSSKLNLAGNYLSLPVNELGNEYSRSKLDLRKESEGSPASYRGFKQFNMVNHLLTKEGKGGRTSNSSRTRLPSTLVEEIIPEDSQVPASTEKRGSLTNGRRGRPDTPGTPTSTSARLPPGTPGTSRNESQLFAVSQAIPAPEPRLGPSGLLVENEFENNNDNGDCDGDNIFDGDGTWG